MSEKNKKRQTSKKTKLTPVEIISIIVIILFFFSLVVPVMLAYENEKRLYNITVQLQKDIDNIRSEAMKANDPENFIIRFYVKDNAYILANGMDVALPTEEPESAIKNAVKRELGSDVGFPAHFGMNATESIAISKQKITDGYVDLYFDKEGYPYWSYNGAQSIQTFGYITLINNDHTKEIVLNISSLGNTVIYWVKN